MLLFKPLTLMQIPAGRVDSSTACQKTVQQRCKTLSAVRKVASGNDSNAQLGMEIQALSRSQREDLLKKVQLPISVPADHALAIKADLAMPWSKLRILRR